MFLQHLGRRRPCGPDLVPGPEHRPGPGGDTAGQGEHSPWARLTLQQCLAGPFTSPSGPPPQAPQEAAHRETLQTRGPQQPAQQEGGLGTQGPQVRPGLLEAPIPTRWLLGGALPLGRGVAPRLQEMVGEGAGEHGDEGRGARGGLLGGGGGQDCHQGELVAPQPVPMAHEAETSPGQAETTSRPSGQGGGYQAARAARLLGGGRAPDGRGNWLRSSELCPRALSPVPALWLASPLSMAGA